MAHLTDKVKQEDKVIMGYRLLIFKKDGTISKHYFSSYETLDYNATFFQFSTYIVKAIGQEAKLFGWKTLFTIGG